MRKRTPTYSVQYRTCETIYSHAGKWREIASGFATREEAQHYIDTHAVVGGYFMDFSVCVEYR